MSRVQFALKPLALSAFLVPALSGAAFAWEAEDVAERLRVLFDRQGAEVAWSSLSSSGSSITLEGVTIAAAGEDAVPIGDVMLDDVTEEGADYRVGELSLPRYEYSDPEGTFTLNGVSVTGLMLPEPDSEDPLKALAIYDAFSLDDMQVNIGGADVFTLTNLHGEMTQPEGEGSYTFTGAAETFTVDLGTLAEGEESMKPLEALGYTTMTGDMQMAGSWNPTDGRAQLTQYDFTVADAGTFGISLDVSGYTPQFIASMQEMQAEMANAPEENQSAQGLAMLGLLQQLTFHGLSVRFVDDSLTDKVLAYVAEQQGARPEDVVNQVKAIIPLQLSPYLGPEFTATVTDAVGAFLDDPQSLEISAQPENPVPFAMLMGAAMSAPQMLTKQLGVNVTANE